MQKALSFCFILLLLSAYPFLNMSTINTLLLKLPKYLFTVIWCVIGFGLCVFDFSDTKDKLPSFDGMDKIVHGFLFFVLNALFVWEYFHRKDLWKLRAAKKYLTLISSAVLLSFAIGGLIELTQQQLSYRGCEWEDLVADMIGTFLLWTLYLGLLIFKQRRAGH